MAIHSLSQTLFSYAVLGGITLCLYAAYTIIYRLFLHPLRKFPGPKLAAATFWYERYFDICVPPGVPTKSMSDTLYAGPGKIRDKWERSNRANASPGATASAISHNLHRMRRSALNPFFSRAAVSQLEHKICEKVDLLCDRLRTCAQEDKVVNLGAALTAVTLDVITEYAYGDCYDCLKEPDFSLRWKTLMSGLFESVSIGKHFPLFAAAMQSLPLSIAVKLNPDMGVFLQSRATIHRQAHGIWRTEQNLSEDEKSPAEAKPATIFHGIMRSSLPQGEKTIARLADEAFVLIVAGGETTARVLTVVLTYLLESPDLLSQLRREIDPVVKSGLAHSRQLEEIPLMKAIVQEGLRIASPVTNRPIFIAPDEDLHCNGYVIPRGTPTSMSLANVLLDPSIFPEPHTFDPNRWLEAAAQGERLDRYLVTFSKGNRSCLGKNIAYSEIYLGLAALVSRFEIDLVDFDRARDLDIVRDTFVGLPSKGSKGVSAKFRERKI